jgi:isoquinoline 1-oxidoreductase subunit alpha
MSPWRPPVEGLARSVGLTMPWIAPREKRVAASVAICPPQAGFPSRAGEVARKVPTERPSPTEWAFPNEIEPGKQANEPVAEKASMIALSVNGKTYNVDVEADTPLLWVLRDTIGLTGTKYGCGIAQCGCCTVHLDGVATRSCQVPVGSVGSAQITTIEALAQGGRLHPVQQAWLDHDVPQCGYCQSGMMMAAVALLRKNPKPTDADIDAAITNICRCGTYQRIRAAIHAAAEA